MIEKIEIVFENGEYLELGQNDIHKLIFDNIEESAYISNLAHYTIKENLSSFRISKIANNICLELYKETIKDKNTIFCGNYESKAIERLKICDITQIHVYDYDRKYWTIKLIKKTIKIQKPIVKKLHYVYFVKYKEEDSSTIGSPNIYQKITEKQINNYYKDNIIEIKISNSKE